MPSDIMVPISFLIGVMIGVSIVFLLNWLLERGVIRSDVIELYEGDIEKIVTKEVDDYGRLSIGTDMAGRRVKVYVSETGGSGPDREFQQN